MPRHFYNKSARQTVLTCLFSRRGFALVQPVKDPFGEIWIPPQGPVDHEKSLFMAAKQVIRNEIPSVKRADGCVSVAPLVAWRDGVYVGSHINLNTRSKRDKMVHVVLFRANTEVRLVPNPNECRECRWVSSIKELEDLLNAASEVNQQKVQIVLAAAWAAKELGWLH